MNKLGNKMKLQGDPIDNLIKRVNILNSKSDCLKKNMTFRREGLSERVDEKDNEISFIHRILENS